ncbi:MAG: phenylalanine--tRNA ligase subunit alpha [Candidatus Nanoarchaeia archaeon]
MDKQQLIESLSPIERQVLPLLDKKWKHLDEIVEESGLDKSSILRGLEFLKNKRLIELDKQEQKIVQAGVNGIYYQKKGLPERLVLNKLIEMKSMPLRALKSIGLNENEAKVSIGVLKSKAVANVSNGRLLLTGRKEEVAKKMLEEQLLDKLPIKVNDLEQQDKLALQNLRKRKNIIEVVDKKEINCRLTDLGLEISKENLDKGMIEEITPKLIKSGKWKGKKFRRYDITSQAPRIYGGKRHFVNQATDYAKRIWLDMGFKEMEGDLIQNSFWNFDALFTAQDHPAREMQDTFYLPAEGKLPEGDKKYNIVEEVKKAHEGKLVGKGWQQAWDREKAKKLLLRTHTTCLSARTLKKIAENQEFPAKYFALGRCFRNETVDWKHGFEFNQTEGIVVDENANFRQLLGYLKEFFKKMGFEEIRIRPAYFPYTEPSLEIEVWHPEKNEWVELGGAGMFRPEVTIPFFGKHIPVLAWGPGFDRIIMDFFKITDLRDMYRNDINKLREMRFWLR